MTRTYDVRIFSGPSAKKPTREHKGACISVDADSLLIMDATARKQDGLLYFPRFKWAQADGIMFSAMDLVGCDKFGSNQYRMREVFCAYRGEK